MSDFNAELANKILANNPQVLRDWITEMENTLRYNEPSDADAKVLKRRIRVVKDYLQDDEETDRDI